jgi:hypothetical protein
VWPRYAAGTKGIAIAVAWRDAGCIANSLQARGRVGRPAARIGRPLPRSCARSRVRERIRGRAPAIRKPEAISTARRLGYAT